MNPIGSISNLSGDLLIAVIAGLVFIEESGVPVPFAPGDLLLMIAGLRIPTTQAAGVSNMPRLTFAAGLVPSVLVYIAFFVGLGALVGQPAVRLFHRAEHRFFVIAVTTLATLAVVLSIRWLARRG